MDIYPKFQGHMPEAIAAEFDQICLSLRQFLSKSFDSEGNLRTAITTTTSASETTGLQIGTIIGWASPTIPQGFLVCDGSAISRSVYRALFEAIGTTYGSGNGSTTFNLPPSQGKFLLGVATSGTGSTLGATGGSIDHTHSGATHTHTITTPETTEVQSGSGSQVAAHDHTHSGSTGSAGAGTTGTANPPFLAIHWLILAT